MFTYDGRYDELLREMNVMQEECLMWFFNYVVNHGGEFNRAMFDKNYEPTIRFNKVKSKRDNIIRFTYEDCQSEEELLEKLPSMIEEYEKLRAEFAQFCGLII